MAEMPSCGVFTHLWNRVVPLISPILLCTLQGKTTPTLFYPPPPFCFSATFRYLYRMITADCYIFHDDRVEPLSGKVPDTVATGDVLSPFLQSYKYKVLHVVAQLDRAHIVMLAPHCDIAKRVHAMAAPECDSDAEEISNLMSTAVPKSDFQRGYDRGYDAGLKQNIRNTYPNM